MPSLGGTGGGGAQITLSCNDGSTFEQVTASAAPDGSWTTTLLTSPTFCSFQVSAQPFGGYLFFSSDVAPTEPETVLNLAYPDTVTLSVAAPPAEWAQPTGTASVSSDSYFDGLGNGTDGRVYTAMSWDPTAGPIPFVFGRGDTEIDVPLTNGYRVTDRRKYLQMPSPDSLVITVPRTRTLTASGQIQDAGTAWIGSVQLRCLGEELDPHVLLTPTSYTLSVIAVDVPSCDLTYVVNDAAGMSQTEGQRTVTFVDGVATADIAAPPIRTISVRNADGSLTAGARMSWQAGGRVTLTDGSWVDLYTNGDALIDGAPVAVPVPDQDGGVGFTVTLESGPQYNESIDVVGQQDITLSLPPLVTYDVRGRVLGATQASGSALLSCTHAYGYSTVDPDGSYSLQVLGFLSPRCSVQLTQVRSGTELVYTGFLRPITPAPPVSGIVSATADVALPEPMTLHAVKPDGTPAQLESAYLSAITTEAVMPDGALAMITVEGNLAGWTGEPVEVRLPRSSSAFYSFSEGAYSSYGTVQLPAGDELTFVAAEPGRWIAGPPDGNIDADGVPGLIEAAAPNGGDGNGDGIADANQSDVTSLPAATGGGYLTIASPSGTTVGPTSTRTVAGLPAPPAGTTLPAGLVGFEVRGVDPGGTATVRIYSSSLAGVTGWAKFHDGAWATLPASDVSVNEAGGYVDITLTDGGPFDDDGVANGTIVDPGGPVAPGDDQPPAVACAAAPSGWSASDVPILCTASDQGSGLADPADASFTLTTSVPAGTETASASTGSRQVCDVAGNCATAGPVTGIKVDRKAPSITIAAPTDGAQITQGSAPVAAYTCVDSGSGSGTCQGTVAVGLPVPTAAPGQATFSVTATDAVGNSTTATAAYTVVVPNTAPAVAADMGVPGLETVGTQTGALDLIARFTDAEGNGPFTASVRWSASSPYVAATVTGTTVTATGSWPSAGTRTVTVRVCDAAGACGTDTLTVRSHVRDKVSPTTRCVADLGRSATPRYLARFGYTSRASVPLWIPVRPGKENSFRKDPARRGQPTVFLPGTQRTAFEVAFSSGTQTWLLNGEDASASSSTRRC